MRSLSHRIGLPIDNLIPMLSPSQVLTSALRVRAPPDPDPAVDGHVVLRPRRHGQRRLAGPARGAGAGLAVGGRLEAQVSRPVARLARGRGWRRGQGGRRQAGDLAVGAGRGLGRKRRSQENIWKIYKSDPLIGHQSHYDLAVLHKKQIRQLE